jgi:hypothetical protein
MSGLCRCRFALGFISKHFGLGFDKKCSWLLISTILRINNKTEPPPNYWGQGLLKKGEPLS